MTPRGLPLGDGAGEVGAHLCTLRCDMSCSPKASPLLPTPTAGPAVLESLIPLVRAKEKTGASKQDLEAGSVASRPTGQEVGIRLGPRLQVVSVSLLSFQASYDLGEVASWMRNLKHKKPK